MSATTATELEKDNFGELERLRQENQILKNALIELELEKATLAHSFLTASLRIRMLLQPPQQQNANLT